MCIMCDTCVVCECVDVCDVVTLSLQCKCKVHEGKKGTERERELFLFEKLLLFLKKKDLKRYNYKHHIEVNLILCIKMHA